MVPGGFQKPDFTRSLDLFRPDLARVDGIEHLVFFPMYKQNGPRDVCCEALVIRVPWPEWIAELERSGYDNPKFVPVQLVDGTAGYDSECAVLFPEMVSVDGRLRCDIHVAYVETMRFSTNTNADACASALLF